MKKVEVKVINGIDPCKKTHNVCFLINNNMIGWIYSDATHKGKYVGLFGKASAVYRKTSYCLTYPEAVEFVTDAIEQHFAELGLDVEFIN